MNLRGADGLIARFQEWVSTRHLRPTVNVEQLFCQTIDAIRRAMAQMELDMLEVDMGDRDHFTTEVGMTIRQRAYLTQITVLRTPIAVILTVRMPILVLEEKADVMQAAIIRLNQDQVLGWFDMSDRRWKGAVQFRCSLWLRTVPLGLTQFEHFFRDAVLTAANACGPFEELLLAESPDIESLPSEIQKSWVDHYSKGLVRLGSSWLVPYSPSRNASTVDSTRLADSPTHCAEWMQATFDELVESTKDEVTRYFDRARECLDESSNCPMALVGVAFVFLMFHKLGLQEILKTIQGDDDLMKLACDGRIEELLSHDKVRVQMEVIV